MHHRRKTLFTGMIVLCVFVFNQCMNNAQKKVTITASNGQQYAGSEACQNCHKAIFDSFSTTGHHLASGTATKDYIKGSFEKNHNTFVYNDSLKVVMEERETGPYQVAYTNGKEVEARRFDVVIGSGKKGQSYLYWRGDELDQLPVSYFADVSHWVNSPGYPQAKIVFDRGIETRCMECHTTFAKDITQFEYFRNQIIYGIDCERCHGPAAKHVQYHEENLEAKGGRFITNPALLGRQQRLDMCALCHSGVMQPMKPSFSFFPGDTLSKYFVTNSSKIDSFNLDTHANQYGLLTASKCFRLSKTMNCSTCHNTHVKEDGNLIAYAQKCISCHTQVNHNEGTLPDRSTSFLMANCVNCHMPVGASKNLTMLVTQGTLPSPELVRSHLISIYAPQPRPLPHAATQGGKAMATF